MTNLFQVFCLLPAFTLLKCKGQGFGPLLSVYCSISLSRERTNTWFCGAHELRMGFTFFKQLEEKSMEDYFMIHENYMKCKSQCPKINFYWNRTMSTHLVSVFMLPMQSSVVGTETLWPAKPKLFAVWTLNKEFVNTLVLCN